MNRKQLKTILLFFSALLFSYTFLRAWLLSFTHDESSTFLQFVIQPWSSEFLNDTNNHILNTALMKCCAFLFGDSEYVLRLPNLLSHILFLYFSSRLLLNLKNPFLVIAGWLLVNCNPFVLDFFSLARGYGISLGLMTAGVYFFYKYIFAGEKASALLISLLCMGMACLANLTLINLYIAFSLVIIVRGIVRKKNWKNMAMAVTIMLLTIFFLLKIVFHLNSHGSFNFGGTTGFREDTINTLIAASVYGSPWSKILSASCYVVMVGAVVLFIIRFFFFLFSSVKSENEFVFPAFLFLLLIICSFSIIIQHMMFHIPYPRERVAIYFIPIFSLFLIYTIEAYPSRRLKAFASVFLLLLSLSLFIPSLNLSYTYLWQYESGTKRMIKKIVADSETSSDAGNPLVAVNRNYVPAFEYYRYRNHLTMLTSGKTNEIDSLQYYDYFIMDKPQNSLGKIIDSLQISGQYLIKNTLIRYRNIFEKQFDFDEGNAENQISYSGCCSETLNPSNPYGKTFRYVIDSTDNSRFKATLGGFTNMSKHVDNLLMVISVNHGDSTLFWRGRPVYQKKINRWQEDSFSVILPADLQKGDVIAAYFWNNSNDNVYTDNIDFILYTAERIP